MDDAKSLCISPSGPKLTNDRPEPDENEQDESNTEIKTAEIKELDTKTEGNKVTSGREDKSKS